MRNCPKCNVKVLDDEAKFCIECGAKLVEDSQENISPEPPQPSAEIEKPVPAAPAKKKVSIALGRKPKLLDFKGRQVVNLTKTFPKLSEFHFNVNWKCEKNFELDFVAFLLNAEDNIETDEDLIFYNNPVHKSESVELIDIDENSKQMKIDLKNLPVRVSKISFILSVDDSEDEEKNFGEINSVCLSLIDEDKTLISYNLADKFKTENAVILGEVYLQDDSWNFKALDTAFNGGLAEVCEEFGLEVE